MVLSRSFSPFVAGATALLALACGSDESKSGGEKCPPLADYAPNVDPASFVASVDNPLFPLPPGAKWVFEGGGERTEDTVLDETRTVMGITATVVHDVVSVGGETIEETFDWYAQDADGNVWYVGEDSKELENGKVVSTEGSWEAGVDGAQPGILMEASPSVGDQYRQEYYACEAEDMAEVLAVDEAVAVPFGSYTGCLKTRDFTPLEPGVNEHKLYCPGIGPVLEVALGSGVRVELIDFSMP